MDRTEEIKRRNKFLKITSFIIVIGVIYVIINRVFHAGIPCVFYSVFKIKCAGCGMTRATVSFLFGDLRSAFSYNAIFLVYWFEIINVYILSGMRYIKSGRVKIKGIHIAADIAVISIILIYGILRLFLNI